ncbi:2-hydroxyacid dehydrogenase [Pararhodonellum marinum]|uniref:2-hydroxyacid dehydrogenase n=1 Tax=Pararhodonellum marinum TaxID=2755358 RepID=UPI00188E7DFE|nr:2-hydroxyacid dehydrogenase [Pararhodonellum marinum]
MKVAFFSTKNYDKQHFNAYLSQTNHKIDYFEDYLSHHTINLCEGHEAVCIFVNDKLSRDIIEKLPEKGIKVIALRCAGFNNVDLEAARDHGLIVVRVPAYSPEAVAEHTVALILTLNRKTHKAYNRVRENNFSIEGLTGINLYGKKVGVIGTGAIGRAFCRIMMGFGCEVLAFDPYENEEVKQMGVKYLSKKDLMAKSDIISLHCPLTPDTHHLINEETIQWMKKGVKLINTSRGALIDTKSVIHGLKNGHIGFLGIDVYEQEEKLFFKDLSEIVIQDDVIMRLMTFPNVLITGHQAFLTEEALREITKITLDNLTDFEEGKPLKNEVKAE